LRIVLEKGHLNLQAHTPVTSVSERDSDGWIVVNTDRGVVRTRAVVHTTNRWASHLLPEFEKLILPVKGTVAAIKAPAGFIKHTGSQHWDSVVNVNLSHLVILCLNATDTHGRITTYNSLLLTM
jgi:glycine/D-amino acid oxidase-like deaminating enzyme